MVVEIRYWPGADTIEKKIMNDLILNDSISTKIVLSPKINLELQRVVMEWLREYENEGYVRSEINTDERGGIYSVYKTTDFFKLMLKELNDEEKAQEKEKLKMWKLLKKEENEDIEEK